MPVAVHKATLESRPVMEIAGLPDQSPRPAESNHEFMVVN